MNAKKVKAIRREAQAMTVGAPKVEYRENSNGTIFLTPKCERGVYQALKKIVRRNAAAGLH